MPPACFCGATANPGAVDLNTETANVRRKIDAGAQFFQTQAIYDVTAFERFLAVLKPQGVAILAESFP